MPFFPHRFQGAVHDGFLINRIFAQRDQFLIERVKRICILCLRGGINGKIVGIDFQPGGAGRKAGVCPVCPLHGRARVVAAVFCHDLQRLFRRKARFQRDPVFVAGGDIIHFVDGRNRYIFHPQFLALIDKRQSPQQKVQRRQHFLALDAAVSLRDITADAPGFVMVLDNI